MNKNLIFIIAILLSGCSDNNNKPRDLVNDFLQELKSGDIGLASQKISEEYGSEAIGWAYSNSDAMEISKEIWKNMDFDVKKQYQGRMGSTYIDVSITTPEIADVKSNIINSVHPDISIFGIINEIPKAAKRTSNIEIYVGESKKGSGDWKIYWTTGLDFIITGRTIPISDNWYPPF